MSDAGRRYFGMGEIETLSVHDADARAFPPDRPDVRRDHRGRIARPTCRSTSRRRSSSSSSASGSGRADRRAQRRDDAGQPRPRRQHRRNARDRPAEGVRLAAARFNQIVIGQDGEPTGSERGAGRGRAARGGPPREPAADSAVGRPVDGRPRAPVEWITDRMIVEFAAGGGRFEEDPLPTAPTARVSRAFLHWRR